MDEGEVLWIIRGHQRRMEQWDDLLAWNTRNTVAPPTTGTKRKPKVDVRKLKFFRKDDERREVSDDDEDKVIVLEERRAAMAETQAKYGPPVLKRPT